jgi:uncharacterized protein (DUF2235 family)
MSLRPTKRKNIALFIDGTGKRADGPDPWTNVAKLYSAASVLDGGSSFEDGIKIAHPQSDQVSYYLRGVGSGGVLDRLYGGGFGFGSEERIKEAYLFLARNYNKNDRVYLFGFSRGAFAARALAGFVANVGLLFKSEASKRTVAMAYALYEEWSFEKKYFIDKISRRLGIPERSLSEVPPIPIHFIGVWDTVKRLGIETARINIGTSPFHDRPSLPYHITNARHALALHDLRPEFEPTLWESWGEWQTLEQTWFRGAHSDVGGGYKTTTLSDIALDWMGCEAMKFDLRCNKANLPKGPQAVSSGAVHFADLRPDLPAFIRPLVKRFAARAILSSWADTANDQMVKSFSVHNSASKQLLSQDATYFVSDGSDNGDAPVRFESEHDKLLGEVDSLTLALHLAITMNDGTRRVR